jgi:HSP20 family molecular chaperone IbpA
MPGRGYAAERAKSAKTKKLYICIYIKRERERERENERERERERENTTYIRTWMLPKRIRGRGNKK